MCLLRLILRWMLLSVSVISSLPLFAASVDIQANVDSNHQGADQSVSKNITEGASAGSVQNYNFNIGYSSNYYHSIQHKVAVKLDIPDYSNYLITDKHGKEKKLTETSGISERKAELLLDYNLNFNKESNFFSIGAFSHLTNSPFAKRGVRGSYAHNFFSNTTKLGFNSIYFWQKEPESYYKKSLVSPYQRKETNIKAYRLGVFHQQVITAITKTYFEFFTGQRLGDRPFHLGADLQLAQVLLERLFARMELQYIRENRKQELQTERGYFTLLEGSMALTFEPIYDLLLSLSYGISAERELNSRNGKEIQVAADHYALALNYPYKKIEYKLQSSFSNTNTNVKNYSVSGGVAWEM
ncbi:MAG: hypothetical protein HQK49_08010 [Oligoflexia bacterium]|nr:hypothetical protein [Oligoflexia bacterium]